MAKAKPEVIVINDDTEEDEPEWKPTTEKKKRRKVERTINTSSKTETLVITQKVRKQKFKCIINLTNICEYREKQKHKVKLRPDKTNAKEVVKVEKIVPDCLRKRCKIDMKRKYDNYYSRRQKEQIERKKLDKSHGRDKKSDQNFDTKKLPNSCEISETKSNMSSKHKIRRVERTQRRTHSHTRYLSPISSDFSDVLNENDEDIISYEDISSDSTTEIDLLIKRTKDRERKSSVNRSYDYEYSPALLSKSPSYINISSAKVVKKNYKINDSKSLKEVQLEVHKCRNKTCAVKPVAHIPRYACVKDSANIPLPKTDKPSRHLEYVIEIDNTYKPMFMSTPKYEDNIEILDTSATDDGTVLTGEMDIVSFHSQGTLVLDTFCSPSHATESPSLMYDTYSPAMSPVLFYHGGVIENTPSHCVPKPLMCPALTHFISNPVTEIASLKGDKPYSVFGSPITPIKMTLDVKDLTDLDTIDSNVKQEQSLNSKEVKAEHTFEIDNNGSTTNVNSFIFDCKNVKVEAAEVRENLNNDITFENSNSYANIKIKEEVNEDSINNNIKLKPDAKFCLSESITSEMNLGNKKEE